METRNVFIQVIKKPARNNMKRESHLFKFFFEKMASFIKQGSV